MLGWSRYRTFMLHNDTAFSITFLKAVSADGTFLRKREVVTAIMVLIKCSWNMEMAVLRRL